MSRSKNMSEFCSYIGELWNMIENRDQNRMMIGYFIRCTLVKLKKCPDLRIAVNLQRELEELTYQLYSSDCSHSKSVEEGINRASLLIHNILDKIIKDPIHDSTLHGKISHCINYDSCNQLLRQYFESDADFHTAFFFCIKTKFVDLNMKFTEQERSRIMCFADKIPEGAVRFEFVVY